MKESKLLARIMAQVDVVPGGCWTWMGRVSGSGYGRISVRNKERAVHRVVYMLFGGTVFKGEHLDHKCRNRTCCNPEHLEPVTPQENTRRGQAGKGPRDAEGRWVSKEVRHA